MPKYKIDHSKENMFDALGIDQNILDLFKKEIKDYTKTHPRANNSQVFEHLINFLREKVLGVTDAKTTEYEASLFIAGFLIGETTAEIQMRQKAFKRLFQNE